MDQALDLAFHIPDGSDASFAPLTTPPRGGTRPSAEGGSEPGSSVALTMYEKLKQIDFVLQQFSRFWTTMQSNLSMLLQRNNHIQGLLRVTHNPRLRNRFFHRMKEYIQMWKLIHSTSRRYAIGMSSKHLSKCLLEGGVPQLPPVDNGLNLTQS